MYSEYFKNFDNFCKEAFSCLKQAHQYIYNTPNLDKSEILSYITAAKNVMVNTENELLHTNEPNIDIILKEMEAYNKQLDNVSLTPSNFDSFFDSLNNSIDKIYSLIRSNIDVNYNELSFVLIIKNEAQYIKEWLDFHLKAGVNHFYIYDNDSTDNLKDILKSYIETNIVTYTYYPGKMKQDFAYTDAVQNYAFQTKYMGFIDCDEFVIPVDSNMKLPQILNSLIPDNSNIAGVGINWRLYGSSHQDTYINNYVTKRFLYRAYNNTIINEHIKTICIPTKVDCFINPHFPVYKRGFYSINEHGKIIKGPFNKENTSDILRINHYFTKSKEEFNDKISRGKADSPDTRTMEDFAKHDLNNIYDDIALLFWDR